METAGDYIHDRVLSEIMIEWNIMAPLFPILIAAFRTNKFQATLAENYGLIELCIHFDPKNGGNLFKGKARADIWEVPPLYDFPLAIKN